MKLLIILPGASLAARMPPWSAAVPEGDTKDLPAPPSGENIYQTDAPAGGMAFSGEFRPEFITKNGGE